MTDPNYKTDLTEVSSDKILDELQKGNNINWGDDDFDEDEEEDDEYTGGDFGEDMS